MPATQGNAPFEALFANPSLKEMIELSPRAFEKFVEYIFQKAGYATSDVALKFIRGVDLELAYPSSPRTKLGGVEIKRFNADHLVDARTVQKLMGAPAVRGNIPAYLVTTSAFNSAALKMAKTNSRVRLINGEQWIRYIQYIKGSAYEQSSALHACLPPDAFSHSQDFKDKKPVRAKVIAVGNNKGGVGKTTTAEYLAHAYVQEGMKVLLIDLDPQANLSERLLAQRANTIDLPHIDDYFSGRYKLEQLARQIDSNGKLYLIPSNPSLSKLDTGGFGQPQSEMQTVIDFYETFYNGTGIFNKKFDWIIIDTPPAISKFTRLALATANYIIAPIRLRPSSLTGTSNMLAAAQTMGALVGNTPSVVGGLVTHWNDDAASNDNLPIFSTYFLASQSKLLSTKIPYDVTIEKAANKLATKAFAAYVELAKEIEEYVNRN